MKVHHHNYTAHKIWTQLISLLIIFYYFPFSILNAQPLKRVPVTSYNINEGLLYSQVMDIAEDGNGFIWLSTGNGVQRFDGTQFHTIPVSTDDKGIPSNNYVRFFRLENGNLWLMHQQGISEYNRQTNRFRNIIQLKNYINQSDKIICEEQDGIWYNSRDKLYKLDKNKYRLTDSLHFPLPSVGIYHTLAIGDTKTGYSHFAFYNQKSLIVLDRASGKQMEFTSETEKDPVVDVKYFNINTLLIATPIAIKLLDLQTGKFTFVCPVIKPVLHVTATRLDNGAWIATEGPEIYELDLEKNKYVSRLVSVQKETFVNVGYITSIFQDSKKNLWVLTENDGIRKVNYQAPGFRYFGTGDRKNNFIKSVYVNKEDNRVLCGTYGTGLLVFDTSGSLVKIMNILPLKEPPHTICGFHRIKADTYLMFLQGKWDVYLLNTKSFSVKKITVDSSRISFQHLADYHLTPHSISDSVVLIQNSFHVYKFTLTSAGKFVPVLITDLPAASVSSSLAKDGQFWVGGRDGKFFIFPVGLDHYKEYSLPEKIIIRCLTDHRSGLMWMGTEKGLFCIDKKGKIIKTYNKSNGLPDENIYAVREDESGNLWVSHNKGISCIKSDAVMLHFNKTDGLQENEFNTNTSFKTYDGELFFGGVNGISSFYPGETIRSTHEPDVLLTNIKIRDTEWKKDTAYWNLQKIVLPHYSNTLSFDFTTMGARNTNNYQYQLVGHDIDWVNSATGKQVRYVLQPGEYVLRYSPGNSFEKESTNVKELHIFIKPPFWKTTWFIVAIAVLLTTVIILVTRKTARAKLKRRIYELERIRALDEERTRISREMHDDIGAGLTQITLMSEAAKRNEANKQQMDEIALTSRKLVGSMNEIIWSLNPENNSLEQLLGYMREQLRQLLEHSGVDYSIEFPDQENDILLDNAQRRNLLLINKEIVHNAIKHSKATQLLISCIQKDSFLEFLIRDNGRGFDTTKPFRGHGLQNIRRRIAELGGTLQIESTEQGSVFSYRIPLSNL